MLSSAAGHLSLAIILFYDIEHACVCSTQKILRGAEGTFVDLASHYELTGALGSVDCANSNPRFVRL